jgi:hypothetical protein
LGINGALLRDVMHRLEDMVNKLNSYLEAGTNGRLPNTDRFQMGGHAKIIEGYENIGQIECIHGEMWTVYYNDKNNANPLIFDGFTYFECVDIVGTPPNVHVNDLFESRHMYYRGTVSRKRLTKPVLRISFFPDAVSRDVRELDFYCPLVVKSSETK